MAPIYAGPEAVLNDDFWDMNEIEQNLGFRNSRSDTWSENQTWVCDTKSASKPKWFHKWYKWLKFKAVKWN